ncbi:MAG: DNA oxidative demethylase AlkB [Rhodocyclaceae bacterium]|nr:MAG: DNA oxidative demethylase AlkB [Rhodocyclaceae bacterium]
MNVPDPSFPLAAADDLFAADPPGLPTRESPLPGVLLLRGFLLAEASPLLAALRAVVVAAPFRAMTTKGGRRMSVASTSCGDYGWVSGDAGYGYASRDPLRDQPWPAIPPLLRQLAQQAAQEAGFAGFEPDTCLINRYRPGAKMSLHQDKDERDVTQPVVSFSLGLPARFLFGGFERGGRPLRLPLFHGDVLVWGGPARLRFHGVLPVEEGHHPRLGPQRINLTFRRAR